jgi:hypothetical protein BACCOPRO_00036
MKINKVNIGLTIEQRLNELNMSKAEFGRLIGIPQQNVNRILTRVSIDTDKLIEISEALDFNFFDCFRSINENGNVTADNGGVAIAGNGTAHHFTTNASCETAVLQEKVRSLETLLEEKERTIKILMERK